jgi:hypothetical protein
MNKGVHFPPFVWRHILGFRPQRWVEPLTKRYWKACFDAVVGDLQTYSILIPIYLANAHWRPNSWEHGHEQYVVGRLGLQLRHRLFWNVPRKYREYNNGYDSDGYDRDGVNHDGYDRHGYDRTGFNWEGLDRDGYDRHGYGLEPLPLNAG